MNWKLGPLGYPQHQGLAELQNLLNTSQATEQPEVRRVTVLIPPGCRQEMISQIPSAAAITTFHLIREKLTSPLFPELPDLSGEGELGKLPGGGMLRLRLCATHSPVAATLDWYIPFSKISAYQESDEVFGYASILENVLYSPQGQWGLMMLTDGLGLLGSCSAFMEVLCAQLPNLDNHVHVFLKDYQSLKASGLERMSVELSTLLKQVYGSDTATNMLREYGLL